MTFSVNNLEFIDSMSFLQASLESLVMNLSGDKRDEEKDEMSESEKEELRKAILGNINTKFTHFNKHFKD